ncbi:MAG: hypothetical protein WC718_07845 [Phycisphaerales bacterium]
MKKLVASVLGKWSLIGVCGLAIAAATPTLSAAQGEKAQPGTMDKAATPKADEKNVMLIFRDGHTLKGVLTGETPTTVQLKGKVAGIAFETQYQKSNILDIKRGVTLDDAPADDKSSPVMADATPPVSADGKQKYYWIELAGRFGEDISQTPIREAVADAKKNAADIIIMKINADFSQPGGLKQLDNDFAQFDELFRAEQIVPVFAEEIPREWTKKPRIAMWVKQAMAGAAFMPFIVPELYFTSDGRVGGLGNLSHLYDGVGDDVVREKQRSLRLGHAEGWAIRGGYDYRLIRAMARVEYVLSVRYVNGKPELFEGYPQNPGEELLTDDGKDANEDTDAQRVSANGNDVLTLDASTAKKLGISKGTIDTKDDLLIAMGIDRSAVEDSGRSKYIMTSWVDGLDATHRTLRNLREDVDRVQVAAPADYAARTKARGRRTRLWNDIKAAIKGRYEEALTQRWLRQNGIPPEDVINTYIEQIKIEQQKDKR